MSVLSKTGLIPAHVTCVHSYVKVMDNKFDFINIVKPAPFGIRPFSEYYNPYGNNCSILCNHPIDEEMKQYVTNAKENKVSNYKRNNLRFNSESHIVVPEDLFRRYTETDSRPQTPSHTSLATGKSNYRRCITPDPPNQNADKTKLILYLRRSHSQDTLHKKETVPNSMMINGLATSPFSVIFPSLNAKHNSEIKEKTRQKEIRNRKNGTEHGSTNPKRLPSMSPGSMLKPAVLSLISTTDQTQKKDIEKMKHKKKRNKKSSGKNGKEFRDLRDPRETQMSACSMEAPICLANDANEEENISPTSEINANDTPYLQLELIKGMKRELDNEVLDNEFDPRRHKVLEEVLHCNVQMRRSPIVNQQIQVIEEELKLCADSFDVDSILKLPRIFSRRNARFELPLDTSTLNDMTPLDYFHSYVYVTANSRLIYNKIFNYYVKDKFYEKRVISSEIIIQALGKVMGRDFTETESNMLLNLINFPNDTELDFRTWCGVCAFSERILGRHFSAKYPSHIEDPRYEIEAADFETLSHHAQNFKTNILLMAVLNKIRLS